MFPEWKTTPTILSDELEAIGCRRRVDGDRNITYDSDEEEATTDEKNQATAERNDHEFALNNHHVPEELGDDGREQWFPGDTTEGASVDEYITELSTSRENAGAIIAIHFIITRRHQCTRINLQFLIILFVSRCVACEGTGIARTYLAVPVRR